MSALYSIALCTYSFSSFNQNQTPKIVKSNQIDLKSVHNPEKWSITQDNTWSSASSGHLIYIADEQPKIEDDFCIRRYQSKLRTFKNMLMEEGEDAFESLAVIDSIQRLGLEHNFQEEIDEVLRRHYMISTTHNYNELCQAALQFRLLRQQGYYVHAGELDSFKNMEGKLKQKLNSDIKGLMELYEASQLSIGGEDMLDEAGDYSYRLLNSWVKRLDNCKAREIKNTLEYPYYKSLPRFMAQNFIRDYQGPNDGWMHQLQEFAKFELKMFQSQCQREILQFSGWWKDLGLPKQLKFARNQPLKWYIWSMATLTNPSFSDQRIDLTKSTSFIYLIDDIFDVHGKLDELISFTEVVNRWDVAAAELPDYMRICFTALDNITNEISYKIHKQHGWNPVESLRKKWACLCNAFLVEARWFASGELPNVEEYLENGIVSSGVHVILVHIFFLLGHGVTKEAVEFIDNNPSIISSAATILRLWDDLGSAKDEDQDGHDGSYVECFMKQYRGCSMAKARKHVTQKISDAWKQLNQECLFPTPFSSSTFTKACLNLARMVPLMYSYDDNQRLPVLEHHTKSVLSI